MRVRPGRLALVPLSLALVLAACGNGEDSWRPVLEENLSAEQRQQRAKAFEARDALASRLMHRLVSAMEQGGAAAAISTCQAEAPAMARQVSKSTGIEIGRTSFLRRNIQNAPPAWAALYVRDRVEIPVYLASDDGRLAALLPIRMMQTCLRCHGPEDAIEDEVFTRIQRYYPDDQATGFSLGDLRGYFWLVVPAP